MAANDGRRSPSPTRDRDGFLFKGSGTEEIERLAGRQGVSPRPTSGASTRPASAARAGFDQFTDYSKINSQRANRDKVDTFSTPGGLNDKTFNTLVKVSKRDLYDICEQSFRRCVNTMTKDILRDVKMEMQESLDLIRKDAMGAAEAKEDRDKTMTVLMTQIHESVHEARKSELLAVQKELRSSEVSLLEGSRDMMLRLEGKITQDLGQVRNEVQDVRRNQERAEEALTGQMRDLDRHSRETSEADIHSKRNGELLASVAEMQKTLNSTCVRNGKEILKLQEDQSRRSNEISLAIEAKGLEAEEWKTGLSDDTDQLRVNLDLYARTHTKDITRILQEIVKIQKALNVDFMHMMEDIKGDVHRSSLAGLDFGRMATENTKRLREYFTQTEGADMVNAEVQTDKEQKVKKVDMRRGKQRATITDRELKLKECRTAVQVAEARCKEQKQVFADAEAMKIKVRQALIKKQYNVHDYYFHRGCFQKIAKSSCFENTTFLIIVLNAIWISVDIDLNDEQFLFDAHPVFQVAENFFCSYFFIEVIIRFMAFRRKKYCCRDFWFVFDTLLVALMVTETWVLSAVMFFLSSQGFTGFGKASILRILRLAKMIRISRMVRLLRAFPEIVILLKGIAAATRSVAVFMLLWVFLIYIFAIIFRQLTAGDAIGQEYFATVPDAMNTLLLDCILPDTSQLVNDMGSANPFLWPIIMFFILLAGVTLTYMLIGVLVDVVSVIAGAEKEGMTVISLASQLRAAWEDLSRDPNDPISKNDFQTLLIEPEVIRITQSVGIDVIMLMDMVDVVFEDYERDEKDMTFENFVELMLKMRGGNAVTVRDIREHLKVTRNSVSQQTDKMLNTFTEQMDEVRVEIVKLAAEVQQQIRMEAMSRDSASDVGSDLDSRSGLETMDGLTFAAKSVSFPP